MGIRLKKAIFHNRAPFKHLELNFGDENIAVLSGINGRGKTTVISYIVDAFYEVAKKLYENEFRDKNTDFYRIVSPNVALDIGNVSFVYLRFEDNNEFLDYIDFQGKSNEDEYNSFIKTENKIPFSSIVSTLNSQGFVKFFHVTDNKLYNIFEHNILTYFPAYRYEKPGYLNKTYDIKFDLIKSQKFSGFLPNPIEVTSDLPELTEWIMDVSFDLFKAKSYLRQEPVNQSRLEIDSNQGSLIIDFLNSILSSILHQKAQNNLYLSYNFRNVPSQRLNITSEYQLFYHSLFDMSAGEKALFSLFAELLKQSDKIGYIKAGASGIVLIDEVDKHLHIKLQKEVLPKLFTLFPKIQFIVSSHSPFLNMGLADEKELKSVIFDLDNNGIPTTAENNDLYQEVYSMMIEKNKQYADMYNRLKQKVEEDAHTLIITEGKTDIKHIQNAFTRLGLAPLDIEYVDIDQIENGAKLLLRRLKDFSIISRSNKVIGIFDRDEDDILKELNNEEIPYKSFGNKVYAFAIPLVNEEEYSDKISIEHYYHRHDLLKEDQNHRRLFLGEEFDGFLGVSKNKQFITKTNYKNKVPTNGIIDEKVYLVGDEFHTNIALSKNDFAELVLDETYAKDFDFSNFRKIYDKIKMIVDINE